jgi:hypothetical protein
MMARYLALRVLRTDDLPILLADYALGVNRDPVASSG